MVYEVAGFETSVIIVTQHQSIGRRGRYSKDPLSVSNYTFCSHARARFNLSDRKRSSGAATECPASRVVFKEIIFISVVPCRMRSCNCLTYLFMQVTSALHPDCSPLFKIPTAIHDQEQSLAVLPTKPPLHIWLDNSPTSSGAVAEAPSSSARLTKKSQFRRNRRAASKWPVPSAPRPTQSDKQAQVPPCKIFCADKCWSNIDVPTWCTGPHPRRPHAPRRDLRMPAAWNNIQAKTFEVKWTLTTDQNKPLFNVERESFGKTSQAAKRHLPNRHSRFRRLKKKLPDEEDPNCLLAPEPWSAPHTRLMLTCSVTFRLPEASRPYWAVSSAVLVGAVWAFVELPLPLPSHFGSHSFLLSTIMGEVVTASASGCGDTGCSLHNAWRAGWNCCHSPTRWSSSEGRFPCQSRWEERDESPRSLILSRSTGGPSILGQPLCVSATPKTNLGRPSHDYGSGWAEFPEKQSLAVSCLSTVVQRKFPGDGEEHRSQQRTRSVASIEPLRTTGTTRVDNEYGCSTCYSRNDGNRLLRRPEQSRHVDTTWENTNRGSAKCWTKISRYVFYLRWHRLKCSIIATWNNTLWRATGKSEQCCLTIVEHRQTSLLVVLYSWTSRCWAKVRQER